MKILVHSCCAPCLTYTGKWLRENNFDPTAHYYNPNIYPEAEFVKRYFVLKSYAEGKNIPLVFGFDKKRTPPGDCENCYKTRLLKTAEYAKSNGFGFYSTTLLISPYQKHDLIREIGERIGDEVGVQFLYHDFREGFNESRIISRELNLYRQKYCGCKESINVKASAIAA
ncbi:MAG: epoxyqueuosine reductase QueH [Candidatus Saganbacteria bacterium]|nr:epoxyqueuosine reductase QueH [Candidatus Saganbacteria bacterium]